MPRAVNTEKPGRWVGTVGIVLHPEAAGHAVIAEQAWRLRTTVKGLVHDAVDKHLLSLGVPEEELPNWR